MTSLSLVGRALTRSAPWGAVPWLTPALWHNGFKQAGKFVLKPDNFDEKTRAEYLISNLDILPLQCII